MKKNIIAIAVFLISCVGVQAQIDRSQQPQPGPAPQINLEKPATFILKNGLKVLVVENNKLPRVSMTLTLDNPPHSEGKKAGVSSLMGSLLGSGTKEISKDKFNEEIDYLGANVSFYSSGASARSLSKYFPRVLELISEGALNPNFTQQEFDKEKERAIENIKASEKDVATNAKQIGAALAYGKNHPYGEFATVESVEGITLENVKSYYNNYFVPENAYLVVVGDVKTKDVKKLVKKHFKNWEKKNVPSTTIPDASNVQYTQVNFVDFPNAVQSEVSLMNTITLKKNDPDYFPALIANKILGGGGEARLFLNLREDKGYTYGAYSKTGDDKYVARFVASSSVRNAVTDSAVVAFLDELHRIRNEKVSAEELQNAKNKYTGDFVLALEQPSTVAQYALNIETDDLSEDFYENYLKRINAVTADDIQRVANKYFMTDNMRIVVVGKGSEVVENLEKLSYNGKKIPVFYYNKNAEKVEKPIFKKPLDPSLTVEKVFAEYIKAIGGEEAVSNVNSIVMTAKAAIQGQEITLIKKATKDGKMMQSIGLGGMVMQKQVFDGKDGYTMAQGQKTPLTEEKKEELKNEKLFPEMTAEGAKLERIEAVDGKDAYVVSKDDEEHFYDVASGLKVKTITTQTQGAQTMQIPITLSNYKEVKGVKFPYSISQSMGPQTLNFEVTEIKVNEGISEEDFE